MKIITFFLTFLLLPFSILALPERTISFESSKQQSIQHSLKLKSVQAEQKAILANSLSIKSDKHIQIYLDSQYKYIDDLQEMSIPSIPPRPPQTLEVGSHHQWSTGVNLSYLLYDFNQLNQLVDSLNEESKAKELQAKLLEKQICLALANLYDKLYYQNNLMNTLYKAWQVSLIQQKDIEQRYNSGSVSKLDYISGKKETLNFKLRFTQLQREFSSTLYDWYTLTGETISSNDLTYPIPSNLSNKKDISKTIIIQITDRPHAVIDTTNKTLANHPQVEQLSHMELALEYKAKSIDSTDYPKLMVGARSSLEVLRDQKKDLSNQNILSLTLTVPLWDGQRRKGQQEQLRSNAIALSYQRQDIQRNFLEQTQKSQNTISQLQSEIDLVKSGIKDAENIASLTYQTYQSGRLNYSDVQRANVLILDWENQLSSLLLAKSLIHNQLEYLHETKGN